MARKKSDKNALTPIEEAFFKALEDGQQRGASRETLFGLTQKKESNGFASNVVDVHIKNLRRKLEGTYTIASVRGFGYVLTKNTD